MLVLHSPQLSACALRNGQAQGTAAPALWRLRWLGRLAGGKAQSSQSHNPGGGRVGHKRVLTSLTTCVILVLSSLKPSLLFF